MSWCLAVSVFMCPRPTFIIDTSCVLTLRAQTLKYLQYFSVQGIQTTIPSWLPAHLCFCCYSGKERERDTQTEKQREREREETEGDREREGRREERERDSHTCTPHTHTTRHTRMHTQREWEGEVQDCAPFLASPFDGRLSMCPWVVIVIIGLGGFGKERDCFSLRIPRQITQALCENLCLQHQCYLICHSM